MSLGRIRAQERKVTVLRLQYRDHLLRGRDRLTARAFFRRLDLLRTLMRLEAAALKALDPNERHIWQEETDE